MKELIAFFKDLFMMTEDDKIGLSQFKVEPIVKEPVVKEKVSKELKLSDLMRKSA